ncbi:MAG: sulfotransferase family protein [Calditrichaeota bacterium]|nr:MAG: sulfotransferase family protein [Calditrichota bacterium]
MNIVNLILRRIAKKIVYGYYALVTPGREKYHYIFILSHMRSGSSLFTHLLVSNPEIYGYGETQMRYSSIEDFHRLAYRVFFTLRKVVPPPNTRYVLDKLLHDKCLDMNFQDFFSHPRVHHIFLLRKPENTLSSLIQRLNYSESEALQYYVQRLNTLMIYARNISSHRPFLFITYEDLLDNTKAVFSAIEQYLQLNYPITESYQILPTTGKPVIGDFSERITSGKILRNSESNSSVPLSASTLKKARGAYEACATILSEHSWKMENIKSDETN